MNNQEKTVDENSCDVFVATWWDDSASLPKHEKLRRAFSNSIKAGFWPIGARLPTEAELVRATPCSLGTVQRSLRALVADGLILRRQGSGTVVAPLSRPLSEPWHIRYRDPDDKDGRFLPIYTHVIDRRLTTETGPWSSHIGQGNAEVLHIERTFRVDDKLRIFASFHALSDRFPELTHLPFDQLNGENFKKLIAQRHHLPIHRIAQGVNTVMPPAPAVENSDCRADAPVTHLVVIAYSINDDPLYYQEFFLPHTSMLLDLGTVAPGR